MDPYVSYVDARSLSKLSSIKVPDDKLQLLTDSATELITLYLGKTLTTEEITPLVRLTTISLITYLSKDKTYSSEQLDDYSYKLNDKAIQQILIPIKDLRTPEKKTQETTGGIGIVRGSYL